MFLFNMYHVTNWIGAPPNIDARLKEKPNSLSNILIREPSLVSTNKLKIILNKNNIK